MKIEVSTEISAIIENVAKKINIDKYEILLSAGNKKGEGYLGEIVFLELKNLSAVGKSYNIIIKRAFTNDKVRDLNPIRDTFLNEILFYDKVYPTLLNFQKEINIQPFDKVAKCYLTSSEECNEYLVLENLKLAGYEIFDKTKFVTLEHMEFIFKVYGQFHASSFLYKTRHPEEFKKLTSPIINLGELFFKIDYVSQMWSDMLKIAGNKLIPGEDDKAIKAYEKYTKPDGLQIFIDSWNYKGNYPVICHGDCWSNNMMFKYNKERKVTDIRLLDWQLLAVGSPVQDLSYLLYSGASQETFNKLDDLLRIYYESFGSVFRKAGEDVEQLYPFSLLKEEWKRHCKFGLILSFMIIKVKMTEDDEKIDLVDISTSDNPEKVANKLLDGVSSVEFSKRIRELLLHAHKIDGL